MDHEHLYQWRAKRAGGRITIYAKTREGEERRVSHVDTIQPEGGRMVATDKDGTKYVLSAS